MDLPAAIPYLPVAVTHVVLVVLALRDLVRSERQVRGDNKGAWGIFIVVAELAGPIIYFAVGRKPLGVFHRVGAAAVRRTCTKEVRS